jgi:hypothetical protein
MKTNPQRIERFKQRLLDDGASEQDIEALASVAASLEDWYDPGIDQIHQTRLVLQLQRQSEITLHTRIATALTILQAQRRVVRREIWTASVFSILVGVILTLLVINATQVVLFGLIAPIVTAVGIAFIYGPDTDPPMEVLLTTPVSPRLVLLARLVLVFSFDLIVGLAMTGVLTGLLPSVSSISISMGTLTAMWLAPMVFLSALAFFGSVLFVDSLVGVMVSLVGWFVIYAGYLVRFDTTLSFSLPDFTVPDNQAMLWIAAVILALMAFWLAGSEEYQVKAL